MPFNSNSKKLWTDLEKHPAKRFRKAVGGEERGKRGKGSGAKRREGCFDIKVAFFITIGHNK